MFVLFYFIFALVLNVVDSVLGTSFDVDGEAVGMLSLLYGVAMIFPSLAVLVRRLHDTDRSGWWVLIGLIPFVGSIVLLVFSVLDGTDGSNRFGEDPKGY
ncbi:MAG: DUF805 domain-containing protein [Neisseria sp.]|nr:DUF805 domain-containing protein [Neisseria sp.]